MTDLYDRRSVRELIERSPFRDPAVWPRIVVLVGADGETRIEKRAWTADELRVRDRGLAHDLLSRRVGAGEVLLLIEERDGARLELVDLGNARGRRR
jgi:hypothetical protein